MKKQTKKLMLLLLSLLMVISVIPVSALSYAEESTASEQEQTIEKPENETIKQTTQKNKNTLPSGEADTKAADDLQGNKSVAKSKDQNIHKVPSVNQARIWINDDEATTFDTLNKAVAAANTGDTIHIQGDFSSNTDVAKAANINKAVTLDVAADTILAGGGANGITLSNGAKLKAGSNTLTMSGFKDALTVKAGSEVNDGIYTLDGNAIGFTLAGTGMLKGSSRSALTVSAKKSTGRGFAYESDSRFIKATVDVEGAKGKSEQYSGLYMEDSSLTTKEVWYYFDPANGKGGLHLDHSDFYAYKATGSYNYKQVFALLGTSEIKNNSSVTADGSRVTVSAKMTVINSKVAVKNSTAGGLNINYKPAEVIFDNSTLETTNMKYTPSYGTAQSSGPAYLTFRGSSVVNTDAKDKTADNGGANRGNGGTYVVTGGSYLVAYDENHNYDVTTPTNGDENGDEFLTYFTLKDTSVNKLNPINKKGNTYTYSVANASKDGKKHVFTPAAKLTFDLNNKNAAFSDETTAVKKAKTIRGYRLDDVEGNTQPGTPTDKNGVKFLGWFYKDGSGVEHEFNWKHTFKEDLDVYAKWDAKSVVYHNGNGVKYIDAVDNNKTETDTLGYDAIVDRDPTFKVQGKQFKYWTVDSLGNGKQYKPGDSLDLSGDTKNVDLYAQYEDDEYTVSFSANGGVFSDDSIFKTNPGVFEVSKDSKGGEVAVLKNKVKYNDKLRTLLGGLNYNKLKPDTKATRAGYLLADNDSWSTTAKAGGNNIRFDDHKQWFWTVKGENPEITSDTTYYLQWKDDPAVKSVSADVLLDGDIFGTSRESSTKVQHVYEGKEFSLTGEIDVSKVKDQMKQIEAVFERTKDFEKIALSDLRSTFTATLKIPEGVNIPKNPTVKMDGLGDAFELESVKVEGRKIIINLRLKDGITNYKELKDAVDSTGIDPGTGAKSVIDATVEGFTVLTDKQKVTVVGTTVGDFFAIAKDNSVKRFSFNWTAEQNASGRDEEAKDSKTIQYTLQVSKPLDLILEGDLLVKKDEPDFNTQHDALYDVNPGDSLTFDGRLNVTPIKNQIDNLKNEYTGDADGITTENVASSFTATLTMPKGLNLPENVTATLTDNHLFNVEKVEKDENSIKVTMTLKKEYKKFIDLYKDVRDVPYQLDLIVPGITVDSSVKGGTRLTTKGLVEGEFIGEATSNAGITRTFNYKLNAEQPKKGLVAGQFMGEAISDAGTTKVFNYRWRAEQSDAGKDFLIKDEASNKSIQLTVQTPQSRVWQGTLPGDILIGEETEHDKIYNVDAGESLNYTGRLDVTPIKVKINELKDSYAGDANTITTKDIVSKFKVTFTLDDGLTLPETVQAKFTDNNLFKVTNIYKNGQKVTVTMELKKKYDKFMDLYEDVNSVPYKLNLEIPNVTVNKNALGGEKYTVVGTVDGTFTGRAISASGKVQTYDFSWDAEQTPEGKDFVLKDDANNKTIQFTVKVIGKTIEKTSVNVSKKWIGKEADKVEVNLYADGKKIAVKEMTAKDKWKITFENLPVYDIKDGHVIKYSIEETPIEGYNLKISGNAQDGFVITNTEILVNHNKPNYDIHPKIVNNKPITGENMNIIIYLALLMGSVWAFMGVLIKKKYR